MTIRLLTDPWQISSNLRCGRPSRCFARWRGAYGALDCGLASAQERIWRAKGPPRLTVADGKSPIPEVIFSNSWATGD